MGRRPFFRADVRIQPRIPFGQGETHFEGEPMRHARVLSVVSLLSCHPLPACVIAHAPDAEPGAAAAAEVAEQSAAVTVAPSTLEAPWSVQLVDDDACTAEALTRHYLLTAAHCLFGKPEFAGGREVFWVDPSTGNKNRIYSGDATYILDPEYDHESSDRVHDFALVQLEGDGINLPSYARLYDDPRQPWASSFSGNRQFEVAGFGRGSDPGAASSACPTDGGGIKRLGKDFALTGQNIDVSGSPAKVSGRFTAKQELCDGDSGAPWMLRRGNTLMQFAVHSGSRGRRGSAQKAATLVRPKLDWIRAQSFFRGKPVECRPDTRDGHRFLACQSGLVKLWFDAESGALTAPMAIGRSSSASGSRFVSVPSGTSGSGGAVRIAFNAPRTDKYFLWLRAAAPNATANTFQFSFDGQPNTTITLASTAAGAFAWTRADFGTVPRPFNLDFGSHTLDISRGLAGAQLDRVLVTNDKNFQPFDAFIEAENGILVSPMQVVSNAFNTASGKSFIRVPAGAGPGGIAIYFVDVPQRSNYLVWARGLNSATDTPASAYRVMLDPFNDKDDWIWHAPNTSGNWAWSTLTDPVRGAMHVILDAGSHMLAFRRDVPGPALDRLFITNDPAFVPADVERIFPPITGTIGGIATGGVGGTGGFTSGSLTNAGVITTGTWQKL